jgi:integrase
MTEEKRPAPVTTQARKMLEDLSPRAYADFESRMEEFIDWLLSRGKNPRRRKGYSAKTTRSTVKKVDMAFRWKWKRVGQYSREFTPEDADEFLEYLDWNTDHKDTTLYIYVKCLKRLFKFERHVMENDYEWECDLKLSQQNAAVRDHFRRDEFGKLYEAALGHGTVRSYHSCTPEERDQMKIVLAQRFEKPKREVGPEDFERANGWKVPSIVSVCLDVGFRPVEVGRAKTSWFTPVMFGENELDIPREEATKNDQNWSPVLSNRTVTAVRNWLEERRSYDKYEDTDAMWLTKYGNPYESSSLNRILRNIMEEAAIEERGRNLSWYSIRHGVATTWANEVGIKDAQEQLRHTSIETTLRYVRSTPERRSKKVNQMW